MSNGKKSFRKINNDLFANVKLLKQTQNFSENFYEPSHVTRKRSGKKGLSTASCKYITASKICHIFYTNSF